MCSVWSLVFFGMAAAKVGCRSSCTRSKYQGDQGKLPRAKKTARRVIDISVWVLQKPEELRNFEWGSKNHLIWKGTAKNILQWSEL